MSEMKRMLLPRGHSLHLVCAVLIIGHSTPSFVLCLLIHSVLQLNLFVAYSSISPRPQASQRRQRQYVSLPICPSGEACDYIRLPDTAQPIFHIHTQDLSR